MQQTEFHFVSDVIDYMLSFCAKYPDIIPGNNKVDFDAYAKQRDALREAMKQLEEICTTIKNVTINKNIWIVSQGVGVIHDPKLLDKLRFRNFIALIIPLCNSLKFILQRSPKKVSPSGELMGYEIFVKKSKKLSSSGVEIGINHKETIFFSVELHPDLCKTMEFFEKAGPRLQKIHDSLQTIEQKITECFYAGNCRNKTYCRYRHPVRLIPTSETKKKIVLIDSIELNEPIESTETSETAKTTETLDQPPQSEEKVLAI